jgi:hypothetical protein
MFVALLSVMLIASETTASNATTPQAPAANEAAAVEPNKKICKRQAVTGQLQGTKRVCMTAEQWKRAQEATQRGRR